MPRVNRVKSCRKDQGTCGKCGEPIQVGDPYVWWKFRYGGKRIRCVKHPTCYPKRTDLTQSEIKGTIWDFQDDLEKAVQDTDLDSLADALTEAAERVRDEFCQELFQEKIDNIMESFPSGNPTTEELEERMNELEGWADELESAASEVESQLEEAKEELVTEKEEEKLALEAELEEGEELEEDEDEPELDQDKVDEIRSLAEEAVSCCPE